ncbi:hypothetical protein BFW01_g7767 [Lasiodiplodia theobromae]|nr:hypothetical protein BFW01_g7767 [Lasiodiplodia theobromae]
MAPPRLDQFPSELIDAIASFLDEEDLLTIRFVCHALRSGSESLFGRTYFTSRTTSLDLDDLHSLSEVSRHPKFSGHTKELGIDIELLARSSSPCPLDIFERLIGSAEHKIFRDPHNKPLQDYRNELRKISESQKFADRVGLQTAVLTLILRNLPALTDIQMYRGVNASFHKKVAKGWYHSGMHKLAANVPLALSKMFDYTSGVDKVLTAISVSMKPLISLAIDSFDPGSSAVPDHLPTALNYSLNSVKFLDL